MRRYLVIAISLLATPYAVEAAFSGPSQSPPDGNVPGVIWNTPTTGGQASEQTGTEFNIDGSGRIGGDMILGDTKALRIDSVGAATFNIGNWGNGVQALTVHLFGDLVAESADASEGSITAQKFCLGGECIDAWPVGGGGGAGVTSLTAGSGISLDAGTGDVTVAFDEGYGDARYVLKDGDTMNGPLVLNDDPVDPLGAATKQYVDTVATQKLDLAGGVMSGALELSADPVADLEAATKQYVDTMNGAKLDLSGGTMSGLLTLSGDPSPINPNGAVTVNYLNSTITPINAALFTFVKKAGDIMTGGLQISGKDPVYGRGLFVNDPTASAGVFASGVIGVQANGSTYGYYASGAPTVGISVPSAASFGGAFTGGQYGVVAGGGQYGGQFSNTGVAGNSATLGLNNTGGDFIGTAFGVTGRSAGLAGQFTNTNTPTNIAKLGGAAYAGEFDSAVGTYSVYAQQNLRVGGDIVAASNILSACAWTAYIADGVAAQCPAATPIMSGLQRLGANTRIYCCAL